MDSTMTVELEILEGPNLTQDDYGWQHFAYTLRLTRGDKTLETPWKQGIGITGKPTPESVLENLLSDADSIGNSNGFTDWAKSFGYDTDSRKAEAIYRAVQEQTNKLRAFYGDDFDGAVRQNFED